MGTCAPMSVGSVTSPCVAGCGERAPIVRKVLADRVSVAQRMGLGQQVNIRMDSIPLKDSKGRIAHVVGVSFDGSIDVVTDTTTNEAVPAEQLYSKFGSIWLSDVSGHAYLAGIDGRGLTSDVWFRNFRLGPNGIGNAGLGANIGTGQSNVLPFNLFFPFVSLRAPSLRGAIPLAAIVKRGVDAFRFTVTALVGGYTNITDGGFDGSYMNVWLHIVYLDALYVDGGWQLERYTQDGSSGSLRHADRLHEYAVTYPYEDEDANVDLTGYAGITFQIGNDVTIKALSAAEMVERNARIIEADLEAVQSDLPQETTGTALYQWLPRAKTRKAMGAGVVAYDYATRSDTETTYLHRTVMCQKANRVREIASTVFGCGCEDVDTKTHAQPTDENGNPTSMRQDPAAALVMTHLRR